MSSITRFQILDADTYKACIEKYHSANVWVPSLKSKHKFEKGLTESERKEFRIRLVFAQTSSMPEPVTRTRVINALDLNDWVPLAASKSIIGWK